jgi:hypothetical protein
MKISYYLAAMLILSGMILPAASQDQVSLTVYVHDGGPDGALLPGVKITGYDANNSEFAGITNSSGVAVVSGTPGVWQFKFQKAGYDALNLNYNAAQTEEVAAYLTENESANLVTLTIYVHDGSLDGDLLSEVFIKGQDGAGNEFSETTDSYGVAVIEGEPGAWQFAFQKDGYDILFLKYNATQTEDAAAYLEKTN